MGSSASVQAASGRPKAVPRAGTDPSPVLRLLSSGATLVRSRPVVVAAAVASRAHFLRGHAIWQTAENPAVALDLTDQVGGALLRRVFEPGTRGRFVSPLTWQMLRARAFLAGEGESVVIEA